MPERRRPAEGKEAADRIPEDLLEERRKRKLEAEEAAKERKAERAESKYSEERDVAEQEADAPEPEVSAEAIQAELAFKRRVELSELVDRLPEPVRERIERILTKFGGRWYLERGRYLFTQLVREESLTVRKHVVRVEQHAALRRESPLADPEAITRKITEAFDPDDTPEVNAQRLESIREEIPPEDEVVIVTDDLEQTPVRIVLTNEAVTIEPVESAEEKTLAAETTAEAAPSQAIPTEQELTTLIEDLWKEPPESQPVAKEGELSEVVELLEEHLDILTDLPPMAGGEWQPDEAADKPPTERKEEHKEKPEIPPEEPAPIETPPPPTEPVPVPPLAAPERLRRRPSRTRQVIVLERFWPEPVKKPDKEMWQKARKLLRVLASRYHIKLTPMLEAYLLRIMLSPRTINGRKTYGIGINLGILKGVLEVVQHTHPARPKPTS